jgi:acyl-CoA thioester hydrolase
VSRPRSFLRTCVRVRFHECDPLGHLNNAVYLQYLEQAAIDHAACVGWPTERLRAETGAVFVARRHEIDFLQPAYENDVLEITTWAASMDGARANRRYVIRKIAPDGLGIPTPALLPGADLVIPDRRDLVLQATTEWAFANIDRGRAVRLPQSLIDDFQESGT